VVNPRIAKAARGPTREARVLRYTGQHEEAPRSNSQIARETGADRDAVARCVYLIDGFVCRRL
jgi:hypothetical protein